jgi:CO/xanthine dehydrogenase Mo-binding subunit
MGQGMETVLSQIVAESLGGIEPRRVSMTEVDTSRVQNSGPTVASRATYMSGNALERACWEIVRRMKRMASELMVTDVKKVVLDRGVFSDGTNKMSFEEVAAQCALKHITLGERVLYETPPTYWDSDTGQGKAYVVYSYATHIAEVEVDMETGDIRVLKFWAAHDVGKAVNPQQVEAQIEGGVVQGIGYGLTEFLRIDEKGRVNNPDFSTYIIPTSMDIPEIIPIIVESPYPEGPYGVKGFGETPLMGAAAAVANAVANATGCPVRNIPILPEEVKRMMKTCNE